MRVGIDVGGTFTDLILIDDRSSRIVYTKTLTNYRDLAGGVLGGIGKLLKLAGAGFGDIGCIVHGTTIGTNALIEREGARTGLITTDGFADVLEIGRVQRPKEGLYDFSVENPAPLVPRDMRKSVVERVSSRGDVVTPLDAESVRRAASELARAKAESVAVSLLFSFMNPAHERAVREILSKALPGVPVSLSSEVCPEFREYERTSTTVLNAYLQPVLDRYIADLAGRIGRDHGRCDLRFMQAGGGIVSAGAAVGRAVNIVNSGPAGGTVAGAFFGRLCGTEKVVSVDMGGTSFDICLMEGSVPAVTTEGNFEGFPVKIPIIDVGGIGAGGGSVAWLDAGGVLNVGPQSAGSDPGPACYGLGGTEATVTDANLLLGRLSADTFLGGEMRLRKELAEAAVGKLAKAMGLSPVEAAGGIVRIVNANMEKGISVASTQKGHDLREFTLVAFGGAGPLHAVTLAQDMEIPRVVIPLYPSNFSAFGLLIADTRHDLVTGFARAAETVKVGEMERVYAGLEREGTGHLAEESIPPASRRLERWADMRYSGQSYELRIPVPSKLGKEALRRIIATFHSRHQAVYEYSSPDEKVEFVNLRMFAIGKSPRLRLKKLPRRKVGGVETAQRPSRKVFYEGKGFVETKVYDREKLAPGDTIKGPAIVEEPMSTTVMTPGSRARVDNYGNVVVEVG